MKLKFSITAFLLNLFLIGCTSNPNIIKTKEGDVTFGDCEDKNVVIVSSDKHIILQHPYQGKDAALLAASEWCSSHGEKKAILEKNHCDVCCQSSYQCR